jgi:hypothetical protein
MKPLGLKTCVVLNVLLIVCWFSAAPAHAQGMSYSIYMDKWSDDDNNWEVFGYAELEDWGGCVSGNPYPAYMDLSSPTRTVRWWNSTTVGMNFDNEPGEWTAVASFQFTCNCAPYGGYHVFSVGQTQRDLIYAYIARYQYENRDQTCSVNLSRYFAYNCNHQCQQDSKCFPRVGDSPTYYEVQGLRIAGKCSPGVPYPTSTPVCDAPWER